MTKCITAAAQKMYVGVLICQRIDQGLLNWDDVLEDFETTKVLKTVILLPLKCYLCKEVAFGK